MAVDEEERRFRLVTPNIMLAFAESSFWKEVAACVKTSDERYKIAHNNYDLVDTLNTPGLDLKSFDSFLLKTFRTNVLNNEQWPEGPLAGGHWVLPGNWYSEVNDIVRTCFQVRYFDGVRFLAESLKTAAENSGLAASMKMHASFDGYYGAHVYVNQLFSIPERNWDFTTVSVKIELQVTSHLQYMIRDMLHKHYEARRLTNKPHNPGFEWDHTCDQFATTYLGHTLHYLEGVIVEVRDRQGDKT